MLRFTILFSLLIISEIGFTQRLGPFTVNSGGGSAQIQNTILIFAIGESVVGDYAGIIPSIVLSTELVTSVSKPEKQEHYIFYPNPAVKDLFVDSKEEGLTFYIYSLQGVLLSITQSTSVSLENFRAAAYRVILKNRKGEIVASEMVIKL